MTDGERGRGKIHFLFDKLKPAVHGQDGFVALLLQEDGADELVDAGSGG